MSDFVKVAELESLSSDEGLMVEVDGIQIALFSLSGDSVVAIEEKCPHRGAPLSEGHVEGTVVRCPWHGAKFDMNTGKVLNPPARRDLKCYPVEKRPDGIYLSLNA